MSLSDSPLSMVLGIALAVTASVEYGVVEITVLNNNVSQFATWIFIIAMGGAYLLSQRNLNQFSDWEIGAFAVGLGGFAAMQFIPQFQTIIANNSPYAGIGLTVVTMVAFYILTNEDI